MAGDNIIPELGKPMKLPLENVIKSGGTIVDDYGFTWRPVKAPKTKMYLYIPVMTEYSGETVGFYEYKFAGWQDKLKKLAEAREKTAYPKFPKRTSTVSEQLVREAAGEIPTNYTRKYAETRGWGDFEIVREFGQNSLDATGSMSVEKTPDGLLITDKGKGFNALNLLMGTTMKSECDRGRFGEGLKIACLAALNKGYQVDILTNSMHIVPLFKTLEIEEPATGEIVKAEIMVFRYDKIPPVGGTKVLIKGYTGETYLDRFNLEYNKKIVIKKEIYKCKEKLYPSYILDEPEKRIYVRNIYVQTIEKPALYSYDLFKVRLSTDRNIPNTEDITDEIGRLWSTVSDVNMISAFLNHVRGEGFEAQVKLRSSTMEKFGTEGFWKRAFTETFGSAFLYTDENESKMAAYHTKFQKRSVYLPSDIRQALQTIGIDSDISVLQAIKGKLPRTPSYTDIPNFEYLKRIHYRLRDKYYPKLNKVFLGTVESMLDAGGKVIDGNIYVRLDLSDTMVHLIDIYGHEATHVIFPKLQDNTDEFFGKIGEVMAVITKVVATESIRPPEGIVW